MKNLLVGALLLTAAVVCMQQPDHEDAVVAAVQTAPVPTLDLLQIKDSIDDVRHVQGTLRDRITRVEQWQEDLLVADTGSGGTDSVISLASDINLAEQPYIQDGLADRLAALENRVAELEQKCEECCCRCDQLNTTSTAPYSPPVASKPTYYEYNGRLYTSPPWGTSTGGSTTYRSSPPVTTYSYPRYTTAPRTTRWLPRTRYRTCGPNGCY